MKLYQLCIANESLIVDQGVEETVDDYLDPNQTYESLKSAMKAANEEMQYMDEELEIQSWKKTEKHWDNEVGGVQYRIWEIGLNYEHNIIELARWAIPINEEDWGSERQIKAEKLFCDNAEKRMTRDQMEDWDGYALKANTAEWVHYALQTIGEKIPKDLELPEPVYSQE